MKARKAFPGLDVAEVTHELRERFRPGSTAGTALRHVSRSGMRRAINVYDLTDAAAYLSPRVAVAADLDWSDRYEAITVDGCGMDMGFSIVYSLSGALYGYASDGRTRRMQPAVPLTPTERRRLTAWRKQERDRYHGANTSGAYAISQRWI